MWRACFIPNHIQRSVTACDRPRFLWCCAGVFAAGPAGSGAGVHALSGAAGTEVWHAPVLSPRCGRSPCRGPAT